MQNLRTTRLPGDRRYIHEGDQIKIIFHCVEHTETVLSLQLG